MEREPSFFDFAAEVGLTKHIGGVEATAALIELCRIGEGSYVLDVGCGAGVTACYLAKKHGCQVEGVDILAAMVERSKERAKREKVADKVDFRVADAQALPFEDGVFDAVITQSVTSFPPDKQKAVGEYARVTKVGGYVGLNESVWLKVPPPPEIVAWAAQDIGATVQPLTCEAWMNLLEGAGLKDMTVRTYAIDPKAEARGIVGRYGWGGMLRVVWRMLKLYARSPAYRRFAQRIRSEGVMPPNLEEYFGYGIFVGQKRDGKSQ